VLAVLVWVWLAAVLFYGRVFGHNSRLRDKGGCSQMWWEDMSSGQHQAGVGKQ